MDRKKILATMYGILVSMMSYIQSNDSHVQERVQELNQAFTGLRQQAFGSGQRNDETPFDRARNNLVSAALPRVNESWRKRFLNNAAKYLEQAKAEVKMA